MGDSRVPRGDHPGWFRPVALLAVLVPPIIFTALIGAAVYRYVILNQYAPTASEAPGAKLANFLGIALCLSLAGGIPAAVTIWFLSRWNPSTARILLAAVLGNLVAAVLGYPLGFGMLGISNAAITEGILVVVGTATFSVALLTRRALIGRS